jgi:hypothetical protein
VHPAASARVVTAREVRVAVDRITPARPVEVVELDLKARLDAHMTGERLAVIWQLAAHRTRTREALRVETFEPAQEARLAEHVATVEPTETAKVVAAHADEALVAAQVVARELVREDRVTARHRRPFLFVVLVVLESVVLVVLVVGVVGGGMESLEHRDDVEQVPNGPDVRDGGVVIVLFISPPGVPLVAALTAELTRAKLTPGAHGLEVLPQVAERHLVQNVVDLMDAHKVRLGQALSHSAMSFSSVENQSPDDTRTGHKSITNPESRERRVVVGAVGVRGETVDPCAVLALAPERRPHRAD